MCRQLRILLPAALAAAETALALAAAPASACETLRLKFAERPLNDVIVDVGYPDQDSIGDLMVWANEVYDDANANRVGEDSGWCIRTAVGKTWECSFTLILADGRITAAGTAWDGEDSIFAVVGGTGAYAGVSGEMKFLVRDQGGLYRFDYALRRCP